MTFRWAFRNKLGNDYDLDGKVTRTTVELNAYDYTYSYDARGRFEKITNAITSALQFQYYYDAASNETKRYNWANGDTQQYTYNVLDQMTRRDLLDGALNVAHETYNHDVLGHVTLIDRTGTNDDRFGYYLNDELYWATYDAAAINDVTYLWDKAGNRTQVADGGIWTTYTPDAINQYTAVGSATLSNNAEHQISEYNGIIFTYYNDGRLASVYSPSADTWINFYYDALGRLVRRVKDGWDAKYNYYDGEKELLECGPAGGVAFKNIYGKGIDEVLARTNTTLAQTVYYQQDHEGNVTQLTDGNGVVVEKYQYDAFGAPIIYNGFGTQISASNFGNPFLFTGRRYQATFGIYEYRARAYHPKLGRFTSEDPKLFDAGDYNLFRYCHNDPLDLTDPMGLETNWSGAGPQNPENHAAIARLAEIRNLRELTGAGGAISTGMLNYQIGQMQQAMGGLTIGQMEQRGNMPTQASVHLEHTFDVSSSQLKAAGVNADAVTKRHLEDAEVTVASNGTINYTQQVTAKTRFKTGLSQEKVLSEWKRVESLQQEVNTLNSIARTEARRGFPNADAAKATIDRAIRRDWNEYLTWDAFYFEILKGGR